MNSDQAVTEIIEQVVLHAIKRNFSQARGLLLTMDSQSIANERKQLLSAIWSPSKIRTTRPTIRAKRKEVPEQLKRQVFRRDRFTCRYAHCQRRTIYLPLLNQLSRLFPDLLSYHSNWKPVADHLLLWVYSTSIEHKLSFPHGGESTEDNLITACYCCNDAKNYLHLDDLAWEITEPSNSDWDGLERSLRPLTEIEAPNGETGRQTSSPKRPANKEQFAQIDLSAVVAGSLIRTRLPGKKTARHYRVEKISTAATANQGKTATTSTSNDKILTLREMWRRSADRTWIVSKQFQTFRLSDLSEITELSRIAPKPGSNDEV